MKTYTGELKDGMTVAYSIDIESVAIWRDGMVAPERVLVECEWQRYEPKPKKVWGIPEVGQNIYTIYQGAHEIHKKGKLQVHEWCYDSGTVGYAFWLSKHHAEQHAKAMNYINKFRALSDVPVDGVIQWGVSWEGEVDEYTSIWSENLYKLKHLICGYVANSREKAEQDLAAFPKIALAHKIVTWGFHGGIVEEVL